jgi:steroid 5-alpha reductase family enzyme
MNCIVVSTLWTLWTPPDNWDLVCANTAFTALQGIGIFTVSAWATQVAAMEGYGLSAGTYARPFFLTIAVTMWSLRLGGFLFYRIVEMGSDKCAIISD